MSQTIFHCKFPFYISKIFLSGLVFHYFSLLCAAVNFDFMLILIIFDFMLYYNLLLCFIQLEMHIRLTCAIKFYLLTYLTLTGRPAGGRCIGSVSGAKPAGVSTPT